MDKPWYESATCHICNAVVSGRFRSRAIYCDKHQRDEVEFHQSLPEGQLTKDQKAQRRLYEKRWRLSNRDMVRR